VLVEAIPDEDVEFPICVPGHEVGRPGGEDHKSTVVTDIDISAVVVGLACAITHAHALGDQCLSIPEVDILHVVGVARHERVWRREHDVPSVTAQCGPS
jgi:hypothetical protein